MELKQPLTFSEEHVSVIEIKVSKKDRKKKRILFGRQNIII